MLRYLFFIFLLVPSLQLKSQSFDTLKYHDQLKLIASIKNFCQEKLEMSIREDFYTNWSPTNDFYKVLYVSEPETISRVRRSSLQFLNRKDKTETVKHKLDSAGYHTLLYNTYGTISARLKQGLLSYSPEAISFIVFHEAAHQHFQAKGKIPRIIEEAASDVVGNYASLEFYRSDKSYKKIKFARYLKLIEKIKLQTNISHILLTSQSSESVFSDFQNHLQKLLKRADQFLIDRYNYPINNAYFLRNKDYSQYYFDLKRIYLQTQDLKDFLAFVVTLPNDEEKAIKIVKEKLQQKEVVVSKTLLRN